MKVVLNDFIGVRGRSGSSRGAALISTATMATGASVFTLRPKREPRTKVLRLLYMLFWDFVLVPLRSIRMHADAVIHATNTGIAVGGSRSIVVVHDTMVLDHPQLFNKYFVLYARFCIASSVRRASIVITPSEHSKRRILHRWPQANVSVVPWPSYAENAGEQDVPHRARSRTVLVVSSMDKHKRLPLAIEAVERARKQNSEDLKLVMVTRPGNDGAAVSNQILKADPEGRWITVLSGVPDKELTTLYRDAFCVLVSSVDEGFCLPALEASANGVPVVHTNRGALPEVIPRSLPTGGDWADDREILTAQIMELFDEARWRELRDSDRLHSSTFSKSNFEGRWAAVLAEVGKL